jgi:hypothetical protein
MSKRVYKKKKGGGEMSIQADPDQIDAEMGRADVGTQVDGPVDIGTQTDNRTLERENLLKAQLTQNEMLRAQAEGQRRENELLQARLQGMRRAEDVYDRAIYDRIYNEMIGYIPIDQRLRVANVIGDLTRRRLIAGLSETTIVNELRDMISEMLKKKRAPVVKKKSKKKSKPSSKKKNKKSSKKKSK